MKQSQLTWAAAWTEPEGARALVDGQFYLARGETIMIVGTKTVKRMATSAPWLWLYKGAGADVRAQQTAVSYLQECHLTERVLIRFVSGSIFAYQTVEDRAMPGHGRR